MIVKLYVYNGFIILEIDETFLDAKILLGLWLKLGNTFKVNHTCR